MKPKNKNFFIFLTILSITFTAHNIIVIGEEKPKSKIEKMSEKLQKDKDWYLEDYKDIVVSLVYDGYINNNENIKIYRFNSPILRMWWRKYVAN